MQLRGGRGELPEGAACHQIQTRDYATAGKVGAAVE